MIQKERDGDKEISPRSRSGRLFPDPPQLTEAWHVSHKLAVARPRIFLVSSLCCCTDKRVASCESALARTAGALSEQRLLKGESGEPPSAVRGVWREPLFHSQGPAYITMSWKRRFRHSTAASDDTSTVTSWQGTEQEMGQRRWKWNFLVHSRVRYDNQRTLQAK